MYVDQIKQFIQSQSVRVVSIPDHGLIDQLETRFGRKDFERAALLLHHIFRLYRHSTKANRKIGNKVFEPYQVPIFWTVQNDLLGRRNIKRIMDAVTGLGIVTIAKKNFYRKETGFRIPKVYEVSKSVWDSPTKTVQLTNGPVCRTWREFLIMRQEPYTRIDRDIIVKQHKTLRFAITSLEYARRTRRKALRKAQVESQAEGRVFVRAEWRKGFIHACRDIDAWNEIPDGHKWILCRVDPFGNRLHHGLTSIPSGLRQYARLGALVPLFEVDLTASQPTITAINMCRAGVRDEAFIQDINAGLLYERYGERRGLGWSRDKSKTMMFAALFGASDSSEMRNLAQSYPNLTGYLRKVKSEIRREESKTLTEYMPSKNNCIDCQRSESAWARSVWKELIRRGIRFLPIHDSVLVFGEADSTRGRIEMLKTEVEGIMRRKLTPGFSGVMPRFKVTDNVNDDGGVLSDATAKAVESDAKDRDEQDARHRPVKGGLSIV